MRLIWKKYESKFDPVVTLVGLVFLFGGVYGVALLSHVLRHPLVWIVATLPLLTAGELRVQQRLWQCSRGHFP